MTPPAILGRVNAVIQTAIYGIRPLGALIGGTIVGAFGPQSGMVFVVVAYAASFLVSLLSQLRSQATKAFGHAIPSRASAAKVALGRMATMR